MPSGIVDKFDRKESLRACVGIATKGRPDQLGGMLENLARQTLKPSAILICCTEPRDVGSVAKQEGVTVLYESAGSARQRNGILRALPPGTDWVVFFDDDFSPIHIGWKGSTKPFAPIRRSLSSRVMSSPMAY